MDKSLEAVKLDIRLLRGLAALFKRRQFCYAQPKTPRYAGEFKKGEAVVVKTKKLSFA